MQLFPSTTSIQKTFFPSNSSSSPIFLGNFLEQFCFMLCFLFSFFPRFSGADIQFFFLYLFLLFSASLYFCSTFQETSTTLSSNPLMTTLLLCSQFQDLFCFLKFLWHPALLIWLQHFLISLRMMMISFHLIVLISFFSNSYVLQLLQDAFL